jgi:hypothetical protein
MLDNHNYDILLQQYMLNIAISSIMACTSYFDMLNRGGFVLINFFIINIFDICMV